MVRTVLVVAAGFASVAWPAPAAAAPPPNDDFANAAELTGLPVEWTGSNVDATREPGEPDHGSPGSPTPRGAHSLWFRWTAPRTTGVTIRSNGCATPFADLGGIPVASAYTRTEHFGLHAIAGAGTPFRVNPGQVIWIAVESGAPAPPAQPLPDSEICLRLLPGPANDDFVNAMPLAGFPASVEIPDISAQGSATREPAEPWHTGVDATSRWYSWVAPADGPVVLRVCGSVALTAYRGDRVDALTSVATRGSRERECGALRGASAVYDARKGEMLHLAVTSDECCNWLMVGNELALFDPPEGPPYVSYEGFGDKRDDLRLRMDGERSNRALRIAARGVSTAIGCETDPTAHSLRCPIPGRATPRLDVDLGAGDDKADVQLAPPLPPYDPLPRVRTVAGGAGDDRLTGSAGTLGFGFTEPGLTLLGEDGDDRLRGRRDPERLSGGDGSDDLAGGAGDDVLFGGRGPDSIDPGPGRDYILGGPGQDRLQSEDRSPDLIRCGAGDDRARLDGFDLPNKSCESVHRAQPPRAVATDAAVSNDFRESDDHLEVYLACPIDARTACRGKLNVAIPGEGMWSSRFRLGTGDSRELRIDPRSYLTFGAILRRGVEVEVKTRRGGRALLFRGHLPVTDDREEGD